MRLINLIGAIIVSALGAIVPMLFAAALTALLTRGWGQWAKVVTMASGIHR